jgi:hypothetical protein
MAARQRVLAAVRAIGSNCAVGVLSLAAFAKLNTGFFDPVASCARYLANGSLSFWQLPEVSGSSPMAK